MEYYELSLTAREINELLLKLKNSEVLTKDEKKTLTALLNRELVDKEELNSITDQIESTIEDIKKLDENKVDKVEGKSLISDSEIERLEFVKNYDDTTVKQSINAINIELTKNVARKDHNHDEVYSKLDHNHDEVYSKLDHNHDEQYASKSSEHTHNNKTVLDGINSESVTNWNSAYGHSQSAHAPSNAEKNVQSDWNISDSNSDAYIKNKPTSLPANGGNADTIDNLHIWTGTQSEYDAISTKNSNTIYLIKE